MLSRFKLPWLHAWFVGGDMMLDARGGWVVDLVMFWLGGGGGYGRCWLRGGKDIFVHSCFLWGAGRNCLTITLDYSSWKTIALDTQYFCWDTHQHNERTKMSFPFLRIGNPYDSYRLTIHMTHKDWRSVWVFSFLRIVNP